LNQISKKNEPAVFPDPVFAIPIISLPDKATGSACF